jgi:hypothetical protein
MYRGRVTRSTVDQRWCRPKAPERGGALAGAWPPATPEHESSPTGAEQREGKTRNPARASLGLGRRRGDRPTVRKWQQREARASGEGKSEMGEVR